jgi:hypothetical protein
MTILAYNEIGFNIGEKWRNQGVQAEAQGIPAKRSQPLFFELFVRL